MMMSSAVRQNAPVAAHALVTTLSYTCLGHDPIVHLPWSRPYRTPAKGTRQRGHGRGSQRQESPAPTQHLRIFKGHPAHLLEWGQPNLNVSNAQHVSVFLRRRANTASIMAQGRIFVQQPPSWPRGGYSCSSTTADSKRAEQMRCPLTCR
eukprot:38911-Chlamydomonas_euryale.AAC.3